MKNNIIKETTVSKANEGSNKTDNTCVKKVIKNQEFYYCTVEEFLKKYHFYDLNRGLENGVDEERVNEICVSIVNDDTDFLINPIAINKKTGTVVDGNHTGHALIKAYKDYGVELEMPVLIKEPPKGMKDKEMVQLLNNKRSPWTLECYILNNINEGNVNYRRLQEMADTLGYFFKDDNGKIKWRYTSALAGKSQQQLLRDGNYLLSEEDKKKQIQFGIEILTIWEAAGKPKTGSWIEPFIIGYYEVKKEYGNVVKLNKLISVLQNQKARDQFKGSLSAKEWKKIIGDFLMNPEDYLD